jgi:hypothetical protein
MSRRRSNRWRAIALLATLAALAATLAGCAAPPLPWQARRCLTPSRFCMSRCLAATGQR